MKKTIFGIMILAGILLSSCHQTTTSNTSHGGSWTIKAALIMPIAA